MKVCIGITTKNRKDILAKAIDSAISQNYKGIEVFVYDDGSTDGTSELKKLYPKIRWEGSEESIGLLAARNKMMRTCGADIFMSLDDDAWFLKTDEVAIAVDHFEKDSKLGVIAFDLLERGSDRFKEVARQLPIPTNFYKGGGHALRLSAVHKAGYYVPFPVKYGHEEKDLGILILNLGYHMLFLPGVHVWHEYTPVERNIKEQNRAFMINDLVFKYRRLPFIYMVPALSLSIKRTLQNKVRGGTNGKSAVLAFLKLIPSQRKFVKRVKTKTYLEYRALSKSYLRYRIANKQN